MGLACVPSLTLEKEGYDSLSIDLPLLPHAGRSLLLLSTLERETIIYSYLALERVLSTPS